ncbi:hypothetical protein N6G05_26575 [Cupriavidus gilardii]|uniref:hypothetical protein n=1 Tax=Cupriavidus gilardii TaxID=82541 RepID=UPI0021C199B5|nr:hypothetical protein [Cupriavidus gilardii]MCT9017120.1 hypothetical protein [Cupriavidus gilardii]MCT9056790.1 hypothetical protein [Cupriavidus gilardii]
MDFDYGLLIPFGILLTIIVLIVLENIRLGDRNAELRVELARERERAQQLAELHAASQAAEGECDHG